MPIPVIDRRYRHFGRYRQVLEVLLHHGFGYLVEQVDLSNRLLLRRRLLAHKKATSWQSVGARLRAVCEELGPTYIKLGQLLSTRPDLLPADVIEELAKLQDHVAAFSSDEAIELIEAETGRSIADTYISFDRTPVAAASIGQVHQAVLPDGTNVVVKVQRPGVAQLVATDLDIIAGITRRAQERFKLPGINLQELVDEFGRTMRRELDYTIEARQIERFRRDFATDVNVCFPAVYWVATTKRILTMQYFAGIKIDQLDALAAAGINRREVAKRAATAFMQQVMVHGFFHADPHPGNILVLPGGEVAFIDLGMVGRLSGETADLLMEVMQGVTHRDMGRVVEMLVQMGVVPIARLSLLQRDLEDMAERYYGLPLRQIDVGALLQQLQQLTAAYGIGLPQDLFLLVRALITMEGVTHKLDADFDIAAVAEPFAKQMAQRRLRPVQVATEFASVMQQYLHLASKFPRHVERLTMLLEKGELTLKFRHTGLENITTRLDIVSNRLSVAIIVAAIVIGSALVYSFGQPILGLIGLIAAAITGVWLVIAILRSGRI